MHAEAAQALAERAKLSPHNPMIWNDLGVEYMAAGQPDAARKAFLRAHKVFPDYPLPLYNLGRFVLGRFLNEHEHPSTSVDMTDAVEAIGYLNDCLTRDPLLSEAHALLSAAYHAIGDDLQALHHMQQASQLSPESPAAPTSPWSQRISALRTVETHPTQPRQPFLSSTGKHTNVSAY